MLLRFRVANFASLRDEQELSLVALDDHPDLAVTSIPGSEESVLPVAAIYGANASGKSNVVHALVYMRHAVLDSHQRWKPDAGVPRTPFLLDGESRSRPSTFAVDIVVEGVRYEYGFAVDDEQVREEWLYAFPQRRRRVLFEREAGEPIDFGPSLRGRRALVADVVRPNSLFLSAAAANNHPQLTSLYRWFRRGCRVATEGNAVGRLEETLHAWERHDRDGLLGLLRYADLGVSDIQVERRRLSPEDAERLVAAIRVLNPEAQGDLDPERMNPPPDIRLVHGPGAAALPWEAESSGTRTWLELLGPVVTTLRTGTCLVVDELDARLHPNLAAHLVKLFQDPATNAHGAQLVFNSHDATLLGRRSPVRLCRDQIWLTEKDRDGATRLFPLTEYRVRDGLDDVEGRYLQGRYGAVPFLDEDLLASLASGAE